MGMCAGPFRTSYEGNFTPHTGPWEWTHYGYFVGCNDFGSYPFPDFKVAYPNATWYSLPGHCPSERYYKETETCKLQQPGGYCEAIPSGSGDCTWTYEDAGEISIDALVGISNYDEFVSSG